MKKVSLVKDSLYSIGLYTVILLGQFYQIIKKVLPSAPVYIGPVYLPLVISILMLLLLVAVGILRVRQGRRREQTDELAVLHNYKAGYIAKYLSVLLIAVIILLVKDFSLVLNEDMVGNVLTVLLICFSFTEIIHNIVFIILEKVG